MPFAIYYKQQRYSIESFSNEQFDEPYAATAALFLKCWLSNAPFTFYTSGSTGAPKALQFSRQQLMASAGITIEALQLSPAEHILLCLDPRFVGGAMMLVRAIVLNCELTLMQASNNIITALSAAHPFTFASFVPSQLLQAHFNAATYNRFRNILVGGTTVPAALEQRLAACVPHTFHTYGMTETLSHIALRRVGSDQYYKTLPGVQIKQDERACIVIKVPFINSWITTNDVIERVGETQFKVKGRTDFVINSGGIKIHPEQLEQAMEEIAGEFLSGNGGFLISSLPHNVLGQQCVCVFTRQLSDVQFETLLQKLRITLPAYCLPKQKVCIAAWPLTPTGKINRQRVNELIHNQLI